MRRIIVTALIAALVSPPVLGPVAGLFGASLSHVHLDHVWHSADPLHAVSDHDGGLAHDHKASSDADHDDSTQAGHADHFHFVYFVLPVPTDIYRPKFETLVGDATFDFPDTRQTSPPLRPPQSA